MRYFKIYGTTWNEKGVVGYAVATQVRPASEVIEEVCEFFSKPKNKHYNSIVFGNLNGLYTEIKSEQTFPQAVREYANSAFGVIYSDSKGKVYVQGDPVKNLVSEVVPQVMEFLTQHVRYRSLVLKDKRLNSDFEIERGEDEKEVQARVKVSMIKREFGMEK